MNIYWLDTLACRDPRRVGGKAASLGRLAAANPVPPGFCLAATRTDTALSSSFCSALDNAYTRLGKRCGTPYPAVAVRSSAVDEDGRQSSFAGQHESYLNIVGADAVQASVRRCLESAHTERARYYRRRHGLGQETRMAVLVQQLVMADVSAVVFSADPRTGDRSRILINATWGLGESLVGGTVTPDLYLVAKNSLDTLSRQIANKTCMTVARPESGHTSGTIEVSVPHCMRAEPSLNDEQITALAQLALKLEKDQGWPVDLECAWQRGRLYLLQCRPITTLPHDR